MACLSASTSRGEITRHFITLSRFILLCPCIVLFCIRRLALRIRVDQLLASAQLKLDEESLIREVAVYADRCDISEEIARLRSHLEQFCSLCDSREYAGRKLDFVAQEMLREANTIGSKANDATASQHVVEIKARIDRLKEQVQNIE